MPPPPIQLFLTTIASQIALRQRQEYILRTLQVNQIPFHSYDLASDEEAKKLWRRRAPPDKQQLPGILVGGEFPGTFEQFEEAVEFGELEVFLRQNEDWRPLSMDKPILRTEPIGVPGAYSPLQMYPEHAPSRTPSPSPEAIKEKEKQKQKGQSGAGDRLSDLSLQNLNVSMDELKAFMSELGLGGNEAKDFVKDLGGGSAGVGPSPLVTRSLSIKSTGSSKPNTGRSSIGDPSHVVTSSIRAAASNLPIVKPLARVASVKAVPPEIKPTAEDTVESNTPDTPTITVSEPPVSTLPAELTPSHSDASQAQSKDSSAKDVDQPQPELEDLTASQIIASVSSGSTLVEQQSERSLVIDDSYTTKVTGPLISKSPSISVQPIALAPTTEEKHQHPTVDVAPEKAADTQTEIIVSVSKDEDLPLTKPLPLSPILTETNTAPQSKALSPVVEEVPRPKLAIDVESPVAESLTGDGSPGSSHSRLTRSPQLTQSPQLQLVMEEPVTLKPPAVIPPTTKPLAKSRSFASIRSRRRQTTGGPKSAIAPSSTLDAEFGAKPLVRSSSFAGTTAVDDGNGKIKSEFTLLSAADLKPKFESNETMDNSCCNLS